MVEGTCRLQDTEYDEGQVVLTRRPHVTIRCPEQYLPLRSVKALTLSACGSLCVFTAKGYVSGFYTETFHTAFEIQVSRVTYGPPAISQCGARCYVACGKHFMELALPGGEVCRKIEGVSKAVYACGGGVVSQGQDSVAVYDADMTLLRSLSSERCTAVAATDCGWVIAASLGESVVCVWNATGQSVACVQQTDVSVVALSRSSSVFAVVDEEVGRVYNWSGEALGSFDCAEDSLVVGVQFTPCGTYLVVHFLDSDRDSLFVQYDVATLSSVQEIQYSRSNSFAISPCSRVVMFAESEGGDIVTRSLKTRGDLA